MNKVSQNMVLSKDHKRLTVWIDRKVKEEAEAVIEKLGLNPSSVVNILYRQIIEHKRIPFEIKVNESKVNE